MRGPHPVWASVHVRTHGVCAGHRRARRVSPVRFAGVHLTHRVRDFDWLQLRCGQNRCRSPPLKRVCMRTRLLHTLRRHGSAVADERAVRHGACRARVCTTARASLAHHANPHAPVRLSLLCHGACCTVRVQCHASCCVLSAGQSIDEPIPGLDVGIPVIGDCVRLVSFLWLSYLRCCPHPPVLINVVVP